MSVKLIVDSACDIPRDEVVAAGAGFIPLRVIMGGVEYLDGVDLTIEKFYENLVEKNLTPSTSQINPGFFEEAFRRALAKDDEVVYLCLSSRLSGTCANALAAVEALPAAMRSRVHVVDSESASLGERIIFQYALQLLERGMSGAEIADELNRRKKEVRVYACLDTLEYLRRGGRISGVVAAAGTLLNVKPLIALEEGAVESVAKARGMKAGLKQLAKLVVQSGEVNLDMPLVVVYSGLDDAIAREFSAANVELFGENPPIAPIGATIGTHIGPGAVGVAYFCK